MSESTLVATVAELPVEKLRRQCDPRAFDFQSTAEVDPLPGGVIGQDRAVQALEFGLRVASPGYNIFVSGLPGTGKTTFTRALVEQLAAQRPRPGDYCYVYNFDDPARPLAIPLPAGLGSVLVADMEDLIEDLKAEIPKVTESEDFDEQTNAIWKRFQKASAEILSHLQTMAEAEGYSLRRTQAGYATVPLKEDGEPYSQEEFDALPEDQRDAIKEKGEKLQVHLNDAARRVKILEKEAKQSIKELEERAVRFAVGPFIKRLQEKYRDFPKLVKYLEALEKDVVEHHQDFKRSEEHEGSSWQAWLAQFQPEPSFARYKVNLLVNNADTEGAPVVMETNPTYYNLFGGTEYTGQFGFLTTDFTMIRPGAIHRANGGYLILQAYDVLTNYLAWDALKRALKNQEARIENLADQFRAVPTTSLKPEPIPLNLKVILIGSTYLYHLLYFLDDDFRKFFKVKADFDVEMPRTLENEERYAAFISLLCRRENLKHFDREAVGKVIDYSSRLVGKQDKLSTRFNEIVGVIYEASAIADQERAELVSGRHVDRAIGQKIYRSNLIEEKIQEMIQQGKIIVNTDGRAVGQVNGIAVYDLGDYSFGKPSRITAKTFMGEEGVVNVEREIKLSGNIHSKGVLILSGYLGAKYGQDKPLALTASITFEQLYEEVEGDSASSAELYALLSSLAGVGIRQDLAVTGSVDQHGQIQPIGGVNEKIEGFFWVCKSRGLTGTQGVLIPSQNVDELMLRDEVIQAVREGQFHIYPVSTVDEGISLLTGLPAGEMIEGPGDSGRRIAFTPGSIHDQVDRRLQELAEGMAKFGREERDKEKGKAGDEESSRESADIQDEGTKSIG